MVCQIDRLLRLFCFLRMVSAIARLFGFYSWLFFCLVCVLVAMTSSIVHLLSYASTLDDEKTSRLLAGKHVETIFKV